MKNKSLHISIPEPCHEDWNQMTPMERGRFCDACQKNVWDFTKASDRELYRFFENKPQGVCGRFSTHQLDRDIVPMVNRPQKRAPWYFAGVFSLGSLWANAQDIPESENNRKPSHSVVVKLLEPHSPLNVEKGIHFSVTDDLGDALAHANISVRQDNQLLANTETDLSGSAILEPLDGRPIEEIEYTITVKINGYHPLEMKGNLVELNGKTVDIVLDRLEEFEIQTVDVIVEKPLISMGATRTITTGRVYPRHDREKEKPTDDKPAVNEGSEEPKWWQFWK
ncbi:MAG: hypothetical protein SchgKO_16050 [Schleiferiaceae bacterium]